MRYFFLSGLLFLTCMSLAEEKPNRKLDPVKEDMKALQGTWIVDAAERDGQDLSRIKGNKLVISDTSFTIFAGNYELKGSITIDPAKKPKSMDMQHDEGLLRDKKWEMIYKVEGDTLTYCYSEADSGKDRPDAFETREGQSRLLIVLKRDKPKK